MDAIYRRFELITADKKQEEAFQTLVKQKNLTREDITLILKTVKLKSADETPNV